MSIYAIPVSYKLITDSFAVSNGAVFMPNTFNMQEAIRTSIDNYIEDVENGCPSATPLILSISKGTDGSISRSSLALTIYRYLHTKSTRSLSRVLRSILASTLAALTFMRYVFPPAMSHFL
jgi:hypothetical protein